MRKRVLKYLLFLLLSCGDTSAYAQDEDYALADTVVYSVPSEASEDLPAGETYLMTEEVWKGLTEDKRFFYKDSVEYSKIAAEDFQKSTQPGWLERALNAIVRFLFSPLGRTLFWLLVIASVLYVLYRIFKDRQGFFFARKEKTVVGESAKPDPYQDLLNTNWNTYIQEALSIGDFRTAARFQFLQTIQLLHHKSFILYSKEKTNYEYLAALARTTLQEPFREMIRQYEYTWFGKFEMSEDEWKKFQASFHQIQSQL